MNSDHRQSPLVVTIALDQQINIYHMDRLFTMDEEDKINLKVETPSATSRIQLRKEMSPSLTPLTKESDEDNASQNILYV